MIYHEHQTSNGLKKTYITLANIMISERLYTFIHTHSYVYILNRFTELRKSPRDAVITNRSYIIKYSEKRVAKKKNKKKA